MVLNKYDANVHMNWSEFTTWQRWDEFPEREDNPPLTQDFSFLFDGEEYYCDFSFDKFHIWKDNESIKDNSNFLLLLTTPLFEEQSFKDLIQNFIFED